MPAPVQSNKASCPSVAAPLQVDGLEWFLPSYYGLTGTTVPLADDDRE